MEPLTPERITARHREDRALHSALWTMAASARIPVERREEWCDMGIRLVRAELDAARQPTDPSGLREYERHPDNKSPVETPRPFDSATARSAGGKQVPGGNRVPLAATPTEERLDAERLADLMERVRIGDEGWRLVVMTEDGGLSITSGLGAFADAIAAEYARLASTEGERTLPRPPRTYPCPSCGEVGDHSTECTEGERTDG
jgi:hypothetical protein